MGYKVYQETLINETLNDSTATSKVVDIRHQEGCSMYLIATGTTTGGSITLQGSVDGEVFVDTSTTETIGANGLTATLWNLSDLYYSHIRVVATETQSSDVAVTVKICSKGI
jgi:hypothetical protein